MPAGGVTEWRGRSFATGEFWTDTDRNQSGEVFVSYDGGAPQLVKSYTANFNGFESLALDVPEGAKKAQVSFRYTGTNSAFRTVDQVQLDR